MPYSRVDDSVTVDKAVLFSFIVWLFRRMSWMAVNPIVTNSPLLLFNAADRAGSSSCIHALCPTSFSSFFAVKIKPNLLEHLAKLRPKWRC
jgi:hypothetical protein